MLTILQTLGDQVKEQKAALDRKEVEWKQKISDLQKEKDNWANIATSLRLKAAEISAEDVQGLRQEYDRLQKNLEVLEEDLGSHICAVCTNDGTADVRYVSHIIFPLPKAVQEKLRLAELEGVQLDAVSRGEAPESSQRSGVDLIQLTEKERSSYYKRETLGVFSRKREHQGPYKWDEVQLKIRMPDWSEMRGLRWQPSFEKIALKERSWRGREIEAAKEELQDALRLLQRFRDFATMPDLGVITLSLKERTSLATWDCANKTADEVRIAVADLLVEVETEVRHAARVYVQYLMKIFMGTSTCIPRWEDAEGFIVDKFEKMQSRL
ncbi:hypothetical protein R1sor_019047 [Riccia sorocarpa]|uniref:Uncharacterized protein n=1 Tax=Riccia sorocarpa TaxID=122646 RepID=A0ABD3IBF1_9MARC